MPISFIRRYNRYCLSVLAATVGLLIILGFGLWQFIAAMPPIPQTSPASLSPSAQNGSKTAVVLTGSHDRVQAGMKLLRDGQVESLFISGVYPQLKLPELLNAMQEEEICATENCIELGRRATNTRQNACESMEWLKRNNIRRFYLITSDYHWPRSHAEFQAVLQRNDYAASILPYPVRGGTKAQDSDFLPRGKAWSGEYLKWLVANGRIFLENLLPEKAIMGCF